MKTLKTIFTAAALLTASFSAMAGWVVTTNSPTGFGVGESALYEEALYIATIQCQNFMLLDSGCYVTSAYWVD